MVLGNGFAPDAQLLIAGRTVKPMSGTAQELTAVLPTELTGDAATVQVQSGGSLSNAVLVPVSAASPGLFSIDRTGEGQGYILNQDGSLNGPGHPAQPGERVTIFATGVGRVRFDGGYAVTASLHRYLLCAG